MSKKILFMSSAKLSTICMVLLLAVFCTIGMSFRPVYGEEEQEIVMSGPRHSHWSTSSTTCNITTTTYHNINDYGKGIAYAMLVSGETITQSVTGGTVSITNIANESNSTSSISGNGTSEAVVTWNTNVNTQANKDKTSTDSPTYTDLTARHSNKVTFSAQEEDGYRFLGWYDENGELLTENKSFDDEELVIPGNFTYGTESEKITSYENPNSPWIARRYARFELIPTNTITFWAPSTDDVNKGSYSVTINNVPTLITTANVTRSIAAAVTLEATPAYGYQFDGWYTRDELGNESDLSVENPYTLTFDEDMIVGARISLRPRNLNMTFKAVEKDENEELPGVYTVNGTEVSEDDYVENTGEGFSYTATLEAFPSGKYVFSGWCTKDGRKKTYLSTENPWNATFEDKEVEVYADFAYNDYNPSTYATFKVGNSTFTNLNKADEEASKGSHLIICQTDGILPPGNYVISQGNTLLIPYNDANTIITNEDGFDDLNEASYSPVYAYRTLTFTKGANLNVEGTLYVAGRHLTATGKLQDVAGSESGPGRPVGAVGRIHMANGGHIELKNGAKLYCFGFITGQDKTSGNNTIDVGDISARSGSVVYENFIMGDMKGGGNTVTMVMYPTYKDFPFNSYFIQNIEVPLAIHYGATERVFTSMNPNSSNTTPVFTIIGSQSGSMFKLNREGAIVTKWYDATTDHFCIMLSGSSSLENLVLTASLMGQTVTINSGNFICPIPSSMHIILDECALVLKNEMCLLPGAILEVRDNASLTLSSKMYLYDTQQWSTYCYGEYYMVYNTPFTSHLMRSTADMSDLEDAKMIIDGLFKFSNLGQLFTTSSGANIKGNGGGQIIFPSTLPSSTTIYQVKGTSGDSSTGISVKYGALLASWTVYFTPIIAIAANLHNEDDTYTQSVAANTFHNVNGRWFIDGKQNEKEDHTYDFKYIASTNTGDATETPAAYAHDKTGFEERMKWANLSAGACENWWVGQDSHFYNWTTESDWHQFILTETPKVYSGSNNKLYMFTEDNCNWAEMEEADENCLYTIEGEKKALVGTQFIALTPNETDAAYHRSDNANEFYICFKGCIWNPATPYIGELKAYTVDAGGTYIWFENDWLAVEREAPFFYTADEMNVRTYYTYKNGEWVIAQPCVRVSDALESRTFYFIDQAMDVANKNKNKTITLLDDITVTSTLTFNSTQNTTCTLDLNGHTLTGAINKLINVNATGSTFTITSGAAGGVIKMTGKPNNACYYAVYLTKGTLVLDGNATISVDNDATYSGENYALCAVGTASGTTFTMNGGAISARVNRRAYGIESNGTTTLNAGTITCQTLAYAYPYGVQVKAGTTTIKDGVEIVCTAGTTYAASVIQTGGTLNVTGGTFRAYAPTTSNASYINSAIRVDAGTATISNAMLSAEVTGTGANSKNAYGVYSKGTTTLTNCVASGTTKSSAAYGVYVAAGTTTIVSGRYKGTASSSVAGVYKTGDGTTLTIQGGYYSHNTYLAGNLAANRGVFETTDTEKASYGSDMQYKVTEAYTITFMNDTEELQATVQEKGSTPSYEGAEPTKDPSETEEYAFDGWSSTNGGILLPSLPTVNTTATYYAHFTTIGSKYKVTFDANGGTCDVKNSYIDEGAAVGTLPVATKTGYTFNGWFPETSGGTPITSSTVPAGHVTYHAQYTINQYTLTWNLAGGKVATAGTAAPKDATGTCSADINYGTSITVPVISKTGYTFAGWSSTPVATMPAANASYTASWTANTNTPYKVIHKLQNPLNLAEYTEDVTENLSGTTGAYVAPKPKTSYVGYITPDAVAPTQIAADGSLEIVYQYDCITYTIAFDATTNGGQCTQAPVTVVYNYTIPFLPDEESDPSVSKEGNDFVGWFTKAIGGDQITTSTTILYNIGTLYAQFRAKPRLEVGVEDADPEAAVVTINVSNNSTVDTTIVRSNGQLVVTTGRKLTTTDLIIEASPDNSGEVFGNVQADKIYFDLTRGAGNVFKHHTWYAFSVPFQVDASQIQFDGQTMQYNTVSKKDDYDILYYDGSVRATSGKDASCWKYVENDEGVNKFLYPGKLYMIANTRRDVTTLRFTKVAGSALLNTSVKVKSYDATTDNDADANWNGIANPAVFHANMDGLGTASSIAWEYNPDYSEDSSDPYRKIFLNSQDIILGQAFFAQVPTPQTLVVEPSYSSPSPVRRRLRESHETDSHYQVLIAREGGESTDDVIIRMDEDKEEDTYIIGTDLVRMGMSTMRPQLWVNRYNEKLCVNVVAPNNGKANYPLGIFVPATGDYTLSLAAQPNDEDMLYLTKDGRVIWNLTYGPYTGVFEQGTTSSYALRIVAAPKVTTDVEEAVVDAQGEIRKVLINNQVFIIRGDQVYTIEGQLVK